MSAYHKLDSSLSELRSDLLNHRLYDNLTSLDSMQRFMEYHVFAVWDFMSLLKSLQRQLTCVDLPWRPSSSPAACRMVNEIVLGEESDIDGQGGWCSHFELYLGAMDQARADASRIESLLLHLGTGAPLQDSLAAALVPPEASSFVQTTFQIIDSNDLCAVAAAFTFGREDLLPDVFGKLVERLNVETSGRLSRFDYYLRRHIELDGDEHSAMARRLMEELCGHDSERWRRARDAAISSLEARVRLWDAVASQLGAEPAECMLGLS